MVLQSYEGTWEELQFHTDALMGHRLRVTVINDVNSTEEQDDPILASAISQIEAARRRHQGQRFSDSAELIREDRQR